MRSRRLLVVLALLVFTGCAGTMPDAENETTPTTAATSDADAKTTREQALEAKLEEDAAWLKQHGQKAPELDVYEAHARMFRNHTELGHEEEAQRWIERTLKLTNANNVEPGTPEATIAAEAMFTNLDGTYLAWEKLMLEGGLDEQKRIIETKIKGHRELVDGYTKVFGYKSPKWSLAAFYRLSNSYHAFARMLWGAEVPFEQGTEEYTIYRQQLDDIALPLADKAAESYQAALEFAKKEGLSDDIWAENTRKSFDELGAELEERR